MKKEHFRAAVSILLIAVLIFLSAPSAFSETSQTHLPLHFDSRGKFRILNISDI